MSSFAKGNRNAIFCRRKPQCLCHLSYWESHYDKHKAMGYFTYMTYMSTASMSFFSPPARKYDNNMNSIKFHRRMAALHFTAMMAQPFLAKKAVENGKRYNELMDAHLKAGLNEHEGFKIMFTMFCRCLTCLSKNAWEICADG